MNITIIDFIDGCSNRNTYVNVWSENCGSVFRERVFEAISLYLKNDDVKRILDRKVASYRFEVYGEQVTLSVRFADDVSHDEEPQFNTYYSLLMNHSRVRG